MRSLGLSLLTIFLVACRGATPPQTLPEATLPQTDSAQVSSSDSTAEDPLKDAKAIRWARRSAEHRASLIQTYRFASEALAAAVTDREPGTWAVALDADETVIDNSLYQKERAVVGEDYSSETWHEWVKRREAVPLPGALVFLHSARQLGGKIAIVTNRKQKECEDTEAVFRAHSIPFDVILCRRDDHRKETRWRKVEEGKASADLPPLDIVMWIGDNIEDFPGLDQEIRREPEAAFERFGIEFFVLPNPMYGSWRNNPERH